MIVGIELIEKLSDDVVILFYDGSFYLGLGEHIVVAAGFL